ncbi:MAG: hypothetical protein CL912_21805 [Deltaproteobacteria bacterium]|nr:hypothetical protein [Deltaproteobacteria bacterium]
MASHVYLKRSATSNDLLFQKICTPQSIIGENKAVKIPPRQKAAAIEPPPDEVWEAHKAILRDLYFNLTLKDLMIHMEKEHCFVAS